MSGISHHHAGLLQLPPPVITLPREVLTGRVCQSSQHADPGKIQVAINFFSTNYQIANLLFNCTLLEGGHCVAGTYFCLCITKELSGSYFWWLANGELSSQAVTLLQPLSPTVATFTPANGLLFTPKSASTSLSSASCRSRAWCNPWAAHPQSGDQTAWQPPGCASSISSSPAHSLTPRKASSPVPAPRHLPQGCRSHARARMLVHCHHTGTDSA